MILLPWIVPALGATGRPAGETLHFLQIYTLSQPLLILGIVGPAILRSYGEARRAMMVTVWGAVALAVLDPVLILWAGWELKGAAIAGAGSRIVMATVALWPVWRRIGGFVPVTVWRLRGGLAPLFAIAGPAIMTQMATPVGQAIVTRMVAGYGEAAVAGMAIAGRMTPVAFAMIFALAGAVGPIIGQNLGAGQMARVRRTFREAVVFTLRYKTVTVFLALIEGDLCRRLRLDFQPYRCAAVGRDQHNPKVHLIRTQERIERRQADLSVDTPNSCRGHVSIGGIEHFCGHPNLDFPARRLRTDAQTPAAFIPAPRRTARSSMLAAPGRSSPPSPGDPARLAVLAPAAWPWVRGNRRRFRRKWSLRQGRFRRAAAGSGVGVSVLAAGMILSPTTTVGTTTTPSSVGVRLGVSPQDVRRTSRIRRTL